MIELDRFNTIASDLRKHAQKLRDRCEDLRQHGWSPEQLEAMQRDTVWVVAQLNAFILLIEGELNEWGTYAPEVATDLRASIANARNLMEALRS